MRKAKDLIGKSIVNQATGEQVASVRDILFDSSARHVAALVVDNGGWFRDARVVCWDSVASIGDVVMARGPSPVVIASEAPELKDELQGDVRVSGLPIMNEGGERIGTVGDLFIDDAGNVVGYEVSQGFVSDLTGRKFLYAADVQTIGRDAVIAHAAELKSVKRALEDLPASPQPAATVDRPGETDPLAPSSDPTIVTPIDADRTRDDRDPPL